MLTGWSTIDGVVGSIWLESSLIFAFIVSWPLDREDSTESVGPNLTCKFSVVTNSLHKLLATVHPEGVFHACDWKLAWNEEQTWNDSLRLEPLQAWIQTFTSAHFVVSRLVSRGYGHSQSCWKWGYGSSPSTRSNCEGSQKFELSKSSISWSDKPTLRTIERLHQQLLRGLIRPIWLYCGNVEPRKYAYSRSEQHYKSG